MARNSRYSRPRPLLLLLHHVILILSIATTTFCHGSNRDPVAGFQEEPPISTTTSSSFDQINANEEPPTSTTATTTTTVTSTTSTGVPGDQIDSYKSETKPASTTPGSQDVQMELISSANTTELEPTTLDPVSVQTDSFSLEPSTQQSQLVRNRKSSESAAGSNQHQARPSNETANRRTESDRLPEQAASTVSTLDYDDFDLDYQIKLNNSDSSGTKRDYDSGAGPPKPPTWSALIRQPHVFTSTNINQTQPTTVSAHQAPHIPPALLTVKSTQLSTQELDKIKNQLLMFQDQYDSFGADQSLAFANGDLLATASHGTMSPASIMALNGSVLDGSLNTNITNLRKLAMDLQSSGMPSIAPLMLENLLLQAKLLPNRSNLFTADETSSAISGTDTSSHSSSETTPLSLGSGSYTTPPSATSSPKGSSQMNQWHNYPHPNIHQNPLLLHHILNKPTFYTQQIDQHQQQQQSSSADSSKSNPNSDIAIAGTASTPIQLERPTSSPQPSAAQESSRLHDFSSHTPSSVSSNLFLENLQAAQQKRAILSSTFNNLQRLSGNAPQPPLSVQHSVVNHRPASWINQPLWQSSQDVGKTPGVSSSQIFASPSFLREFYTPQPSVISSELTSKQEFLLKLLRQKQLLQQQQVLQNKSDTRQASSISDEDMSTYVAQLSQQHSPTSSQDQMTSSNRQGNSDAQIADLLKHLRSSNSGLNLTELELAVQNLLDSHTVSVQPQESSKGSTTTTGDQTTDSNSPPSKLQASNWHRRPTVHVAPPLDSAHLLKALATDTASASNQSSINVSPLEQTPNQQQQQQQNKDVLAEQLLNRKKQLAFIEALKMKLQQVPGADGSISSGNSLDEILALGSGESNGTTSGGASETPLTTNDFDDQVTNRQIPKWLERQILQGGFVHQSARTLPTIGKTIRTTYIGRPPTIPAGAHNIGPLFFRPAASQLQLIRQPTLINAPQPLVRLGPQQALQLLLGNTQFSLQRLPPPPQDQQIVAKIVTQDSPTAVTNTQSNQSQAKLLAESFPLASAPAYLIKLPTLTGGTITASGSFAPPSMRFLRGRPLVPLRVLSAPSRIRLIPAAATSSSSQSLLSSLNKNAGSSIQHASSMVHSQHQFPPMNPLMNPHFLHAHLLHQHQHQQQQQQQQQQHQQQLIQQQQQLLRPLLAMASLQQQQVPHLAHYNPANFAASVPSQIPPPLAPLQTDPTVEPNSLLNIPPPSAAAATATAAASPIPNSISSELSPNSQAARFQQLYPSASQMSISDNLSLNLSNSSPRQPVGSFGIAGSDGPIIITDSGSSGGPKVNGALSRLQQATASLVELTSLASLVDEMAGSDIDPSPAVALVQALSSLQHNNNNNAASGNSQSLQYQVDGATPQITPPLTLKSLLNGHLWRDRQLSKMRDMNNLERLVAAANAANAAKGTQARLKVKYIRVPVAVYESTNEPVLTGTRSLLGQAQLADFAAAVRDAKQGSTAANQADSSSSTTTGSSSSGGGGGGEQQSSSGSVASPSSTNYMFDELSSDSSPHLALALQELAQKQPVDQNELLALASSYRNSLQNDVNQGQLIDPLELYVSLANAPRLKSVRPSSGRRKRARKGRKKEFEFEAVDESSGDVMDTEASTEVDEDDRVTRKDLPILESLINTIFHGPQPMYGPMYSPIPMPDSYASPWYRHRPLRAEASGIVESYVPHPLRHHHHHHSLNPFTRHRFTLGEVVGALGAKKIITSLLSKSRRSRTSKRTITQGSGIALAGGQSALSGSVSGQVQLHNSSSSPKAHPQPQVQTAHLMNQPPMSQAKPNPVFVWFPVGSDSAASGKRTKSKLAQQTNNKTPVHQDTASVIHGAQRLTSGGSNTSNSTSQGSLMWKKASANSISPTTSTSSSTSGSSSTSNINTNGAASPVNWAGQKVKSNNHKPTSASSPSYNFKSFFQASSLSKVNQSASANNINNNNNGSASTSLEEHRRRAEVTAIPLYHVVADHYSKLYSEPSTQLAKHPSVAESPKNTS